VLEDTRERYRRWCERRLDQQDVVYLFLDALYLKLHPDDEPAEGVLVAWGVTLEGRKVLLGPALGSRESYEAWLSFGRDLAARGMNAPALIVADGAPGLWEGRQGAVLVGRRAALHRSRVQERDREAARAPPPRAEGALVERLR
jgi:transposase-like protein